MGIYQLLNRSLLVVVLEKHFLLTPQIRNAINVLLSKKFLKLADTNSPLKKKMLKGTHLFYLIKNLENPFTPDLDSEISFGKTLQIKTKGYAKNKKKK